MGDIEPTLLKEDRLLRTLEIQELLSSKTKSLKQKLCSVREFSNRQPERLLTRRERVLGTMNEGSRPDNITGTNERKEEGMSKRGLLVAFIAIGLVVLLATTLSAETESKTIVFTGSVAVGRLVKPGTEVYRLQNPYVEVKVT